jgi:hypothetical protein
MKNPFEHSNRPPSSKKPKPAVSPRAAMALSAGSSGLEVMSHGQSPNDYRKRVPMPENLPREQVIEPKPVRKTIPPSGTTRRENAAPSQRRAAMLSTSQGFEIMDNNLPKDNYVARVREAQDLPAPGKATVIPKEKVSGDNYIKAYRQQQAIDLAQDAKKVKAKARTDKIVDERKQMETYVGQARKLQSEIALLRRQLGQNPDIDRRLSSNIQELMNELNRIPSVYW